MKPMGMGHLRTHAFFVSLAEPLLQLAIASAAQVEARVCDRRLIWLAGVEGFAWWLLLVCPTAQLKIPIGRLLLSVP